MAKVKMGYDRLKVPEQVARTRAIISAMNGNPNYPSPVPSLGDVASANNALETAYNESRGRDKDKAAIMRMRRKELLGLIVQLAGYVQQASAGDEEKILSSGFDVVRRGVPGSATPEQVMNVRLGDGSASGLVKVRWAKTAGAVNYIIESSLNSDFSGSIQRTSTTSIQKEIGEYTPATTVWVRVYALGRQNPGTTSVPVSIIVR